MIQLEASWALFFLHPQSSLYSSCVSSHGRSRFYLWYSLSKNKDWYFYCLKPPVVIVLYWIFFLGNKISHLILLMSSQRSLALQKWYVGTTLLNKFHILTSFNVFNLLFYEVDDASMKFYCYFRVNMKMQVICGGNKLGESRWRQLTLFY